LYKFKKEWKADSLRVLSKAIICLYPDSV